MTRILEENLYLNTVGIILDEKYFDRQICDHFAKSFDSFCFRLLKNILNISDYGFVVPQPGKKNFKKNGLKSC